MVGLLIFIVIIAFFVLGALLMGCRVGWHKWDKWAKPENRLYSTIHHQDRECVRCGKVQTRKV